VFFVSVGTLVIGFLGLIIKYCLKSKCESVRLCGGLIQIKRRVDLETELEIHEIDAKVKDPVDQEEHLEYELEAQEKTPYHPKTGRRLSRPKNPKSFYPRKDLPPQATSLAPLVNPPTHSESTSNSEV
jgi:hypothetical protein